MRWFWLSWLIGSLTIANIAPGQAEPAAAAGQSTGCPLGVAVCAAGFNDAGQLGDGSHASSSAFVSVVHQPSLPLRSLAAGYDDSLVALRTSEYTSAMIT
jgi:hypothetical protein